MPCRRPPSASETTCNQISSAAVCAIHALGCAPACMKHGTKMRRRRLFLASEGLRGVFRRQGKTTTAD
jgi:hypothetical protein